VGQGRRPARAPCSLPAPSKATARAGGPGEGQHSLEVDLLARRAGRKILGEELALPRIQSKGKKNLTTPKVKYTGVHTTGPESLRHLKRTYKQALKAQHRFGTYNPKIPIVVPTREDKRTELAHDRAAQVERWCVMLHDGTSRGSMGDEQKENIVRHRELLDRYWCAANYKGAGRRAKLSSEAAVGAQRCGESITEASRCGRCSFCGCVGPSSPTTSIM